jgi:NAD-dependent dihydropyrimidine dehydrogenase PreA subunit
MKKKLDQSNCSDVSQKLMPIVNFNNCGGKEDCVVVCPYDVFEMRPISKEDKEKLNLKGKIKTFFFEQKAYVTKPDLCHSCGLCIQTCPEKAIKLTRFNNDKDSIDEQKII